MWNVAARSVAIPLGGDFARDLSLLTLVLASILMVAGCLVSVGTALHHAARAPTAGARTTSPRAGEHRAAA